MAAAQAAANGLQASEREHREDSEGARRPRGVERGGREKGDRKDDRRADVVREEEEGKRQAMKGEGERGEGFD